MDDTPGMRGKTETDRTERRRDALSESQRCASDGEHRCIDEQMGAHGLAIVRSRRSLQPPSLALPIQPAS